MTKDNILIKLKRIEEEGINITRQAQEEDAIYRLDIDNPDPVDFLHKTHLRYIEWKIKIKEPKIKIVIKSLK